MKFIRRKSPASLLVIGVLSSMTLYVLMLIIQHIHDPLWYEEVWRAHAISTMTLQRHDAEAPIGIGYFMITKVLSLIVNTEFTQRFLTYLFSLLTPWLVYYFGKLLAGRRFGLGLAILVTASPLFLEFVTTNKPYPGDIFFSILYLTAYARYLHDSKRWRQLIIVALVAISFSMATFYLLAGSLAHLIWLHRGKPSQLKNYLKGAIIITAYGLLLYVFFLHPQTTTGLKYYWFGGQSYGISQKLHQDKAAFTGMFKGEIVLQDSIFNLQKGAIVTTPAMAGQNWSGQELRLYEAVAFLLFIIGAILMLRDPKLSFVPIAAGVTLLATLFTDWLKLWPFGANRVNIFLAIIMLIVVAYGAYQGLRTVFKSFVWFQLTLCLLLLGGIVNLSYKTIQIHQKTAYNHLILTGMRGAALFVKQNSQTKDKIYVYHFLSEPSFKYYYQDYSTARGYNHHASTTIYFDRTTKSLPILKQIPASSRSSNDVWAVWPLVYGSDPTEGYQDEGYTHMTEARYQDVLVVHLQKQH